MIYLEAPDRLERYSQLDLSRTIFLAGSITGAFNWQQEAKEALLPHFNLFNPRRKNYSALDPSQERLQIGWEYQMLDLAEITLFYFDWATLAPITLLEYGKQLVKCKYAPYRKTYVCIHPDYKRMNDVIIQTELMNPEALTHFFLEREQMYARIIEDFKPHELS